MTISATPKPDRPLPPKVVLVPWDPESAEHVERLYNQRVACGWNYNMIEEWRVMQREGQKAIHWIVLSQDDAGRDGKLVQHTSRHPKEKDPISDTATSLLQAPRTPSVHTPFIPVGHISLDSENPYDSTLADKSQHLYCITTFYISHALQSTGLGSAAMDAVELLAVKPPLRAQALALDTMAKERHDDVELWHAFGTERPKVVVQDWYARRGYRVYKRKEQHYTHPDLNGKVWSLPAVLMKKSLV